MQENDFYTLIGDKDDEGGGGVQEAESAEGSTDQVKKVAPYVRFYVYLESRQAWKKHMMYGGIFFSSKRVIYSFIYL